MPDELNIKGAPYIPDLKGRGFSRKALVKICSTFTRHFPQANAPYGNKYKAPGKLGEAHYRLPISSSQKISARKAISDTISSGMSISTPDLLMARLTPLIKRETDEKNDTNNNRKSSHV